MSVSVFPVATGHGGDRVLWASESGVMVVGAKEGDAFPRYQINSFMHFNVLEIPENPCRGTGQPEGKKGKTPYGVDLVVVVAIRLGNGVATPAPN